MASFLASCLRRATSVPEGSLSPSPQKRMLAARSLHSFAVLPRTRSAGAAKNHMEQHNISHEVSLEYSHAAAWTIVGYVLNAVHVGSSASSLDPAPEVVGGCRPSTAESDGVVVSPEGLGVSPSPSPPSLPASTSPSSPDSFSTRLHCGFLVSRLFSRSCDRSARLSVSSGMITVGGSWIVEGVRGSCAPNL